MRIKRVAAWFAAAVSLLVAVLAGMVIHTLRETPPLMLIVEMNPDVWTPWAAGIGPWASRQALYALHPTAEEVSELNRQAGARYALAVLDPAEAERVLTHLLSHGVDINAAGEDTAAGWTALHSAAIEGDAKGVRLLLAHGARPELQDRQGHTPLDLAKLAQLRTPGAEHAEVIQLLETAAP